MTARSRGGPSSDRPPEVAGKRSLTGVGDRHPDNGKAAGAGEMLNVHDLKAAYEQAIGHPTSNSTVYNLLTRHGWRKLMPRPFHPRRDLAAQDDFKKAASHAP